MGAGRPPRVKDLAPVDVDTSSSSDEGDSTGCVTPPGSRGPLISRLLEHLQCPACREPYRDAKLLPCLCTFCGPCVTAMFEQQQEQAHYASPRSLNAPSPSSWRFNGRQNSDLEPIAEALPFRCPGCSKACPPEVHPEDLPTHHLANNLVDLWKMLGGGSQKDGGLHKCQECACTVPSRTLSRCAECLIYLCDACTNHHKRAVSTRGHTLMSLAELFESSDLHPLAACKRLTCASHPHRPVECFCHDCEQGVCMLCSMTTCGAHKRCELEAVAGAERDALEDLMCELTEKVQRLSLEAAWRQADADNVGTKLVSVVPEIEGAVAEVMAAVDIAATRVKERVLGQVASVRGELKKQIDAMDGRVLAAESALQCAASIIGRCSDSELIELKDVVRSRLLELLAEDWEHERPSMVLSFDMRDVVNEAVNTFKHLVGGEVEEEMGRGEGRQGSTAGTSAPDEKDFERMKRRCDDLAFELEQARARAEALERMVACEAHKAAVSRAEVDSMRVIMARDSAHTTLERVKEFMQVNRLALSKALTSSGAALVVRGQSGTNDLIKLVEDKTLDKKNGAGESMLQGIRTSCDVQAFLAGARDGKIERAQVSNDWGEKTYGNKETLSLEQLFGLHASSHSSSHVMQ